MMTRKKIYAAIALFIGSLTLVGVLFFFNVLGIYQLKLSNQLFVNFSNLVPSPEITVVNIDEPTISPDSGLGDPNAWSRSVYAKVLNNINKYHPKMVIFDVLFKTARDSEGDDAFVQELSNTDKVILGFRASTTADAYFQLPLSKFLKPNVQLASMFTLADPDGVIRTYHPAVTDAQSKIQYDGLAFKAYKLLTGRSTDAVPLENGEMLINYSNQYSKQRDSLVSLLDVHDDSLPHPEIVFKDKIVLIGASADNLMDNYFTPVSPDAKMPGVLIHANALQTLLSGQFLRNESAGEKILVLLLLCALSCLVFMFTRIRWSVAYLFGAMVVYAGAIPFAFQHGLILDLIYPYLLLVVAFMAVYIYRYFNEYKEKIAAVRTVYAFTSPVIAEKAVLDIDKIRYGMEDLEITCVFIDVIGSSHLFEKFGRNNINRLFMDYRTIMGERVLMNAYNGTLSKIEGDGIMAFFNAPVAQADHAGRACAAALSMRETLPKLYQKWQEDPEVPEEFKKTMMDFRCGINSGMASVGNNGTPNRIVYTPTGDTVDIASRLEGASDHFGTRIIIGEETLRESGGGFEVRDLNFVRVYGKKEPLHIYELLGLKGQLSAEKSRLVGLYHAALAIYCERQFSAALAQFDKILEEFPDDGPSKFYRQRCQGFISIPPGEDWDGVYDLPTK